MYGKYLQSIGKWHEAMIEFEKAGTNKLRGSLMDFLFVFAFCFLNV